LKIALATRNADKVLEIRLLLPEAFRDALSLSDFPGAPDIEEDGSSLVENALIKARAANRITGLPCVADDTGLEVDALDGAPGVFSSRFAGEHASYADNVRKLLRLMENVPPGQRSARFRCVSALKDGDREEWVEGVCEGRILERAKGGQGFGYDPVFFVPSCGKTLAEMSVEEKNRLSHRGMAFREMGRILEKWYGSNGPV